MAAGWVGQHNSVSARHWPELLKKRELWCVCRMAMPASHGTIMLVAVEQDRYATCFTVELYKIMMIAVVVQVDGAHAL
jgi:hypothetical protein